ncbi:MAG: hypothetical protein ACRDMV_18230 [Streptosporangiales bacterium]
MSSKRIDELDSSLNTTTELEKYTKRVRDLCRDLYMELEYGAEILQQNLATLPVAGGSSSGMFGSVNSRARAKKVADTLRRAAEAQKYAGGLSVKTWRLFVQSFAPEIDAARQKNPKQPAFKVED